MKVEGSQDQWRTVASRVVDPDLHFECGSGSRRAKMTYKYREK
jgi:hypothetical protein